MSDTRKFNIRVYGIHINPKKQLLVTDEYRMNMYMTKLPGGGLEYGEGSLACLKRECKEELGCEIENIKHFYTTDYFQPTTLIDKKFQQLISLYYTFDFRNPVEIATTDVVFDFDEIEGSQSFRWVDLKDIDEDVFTFPIDKKVALLIKERFIEN